MTLRSGEPQGTDGASPPLDRRLRRAGVGLAAVATGAGLLGLLWVLGGWLVVSQSLAPSDLIVVLAGDGERVAEGIRLFRQGMGRKVLFTAAFLEGESEKPPRSSEEDRRILYWREELRRALEGQVIPSSSVLLDRTTSSTCEEVGLVARLMREGGHRSAIVVSSPYHMRRVQWIFRALIEDKRYDIRLHPVRDSWFMNFGRGRNGDSVAVLLKEYFKLGYAYFAC